MPLLTRPAETATTDQMTVPLIIIVIISIRTKCTHKNVKTTMAASRKQLSAKAELSVKY